MNDEAKCADLLNHNTEFAFKFFNPSFISSPSSSSSSTMSAAGLNWDGGFLPQMSHPLFEKHLQLRR